MGGLIGRVSGKAPAPTQDQQLPEGAPPQPRGGEGTRTRSPHRHPRTRMGPVGVGVGGQCERVFLWGGYGVGGG